MLLGFFPESLSFGLISPSEESLPNLSASTFVSTLDLYTDGPSDLLVSSTTMSMFLVSLDPSG
ncbi:hypothetical protein EEI45_06520 [Erysipelothrix piscisicarius]|uniref:Uncharacterized protein n=1 Tax=Erysipelothrix piscisicarius TaxID=2485784 RepID=A0A3Q8S7U7_9FIRM|nr:hypothetical protein [Erysipelothrix piscisicarius]AZK44434.1 hypothetical protein EEI45_06520 [Erysipelothrix piscisicarius]